MNLVIIFGPSAVGKMTVGAELQKITGLKLFHNHMTIDLVLNFFSWGEPQFKLVSEFRNRIFEEVASSNLRGLIFTYVWAFDQPADKEFIDDCCEIFREKGAEIAFVELEAQLSTRLQRNRSTFRLQEKRSKRDVDASENILLMQEKAHRLNSHGDFYYPESYLRIDNTNLKPEEVARIISERFLLPIIQG